MFDNAKLSKQIRQLMRTPTGRYLVVGVSVYIFELVVIYVAQRLGANPLVAVGLSFWLGLIVSFLLQKLFTFGDKRMHKKVLLPQIAAVCLLVLFNFGFTLLLTKLLQDLLPPAATRTLALGLTTIWNFYLYKTKIFKDSVTALIE